MERFYDNEPDKDREPFFGNNGGNNNDEDDDEEDDDDEDDEEMSFINQQGMVDIMQMDLAKTELNQQLLARAVDIAKQSWFWSFRSSNSKMREITKIYKELLILTHGLDEKKGKDQDADI